MSKWAEKPEDISSTGFDAHLMNGAYEIHFFTNDKEKFYRIERACQKEVFNPDEDARFGSFGFRLTQKAKDRIKEKRARYEKNNTP